MYFRLNDAQATTSKEVCLLNHKTSLDMTAVNLQKGIEVQEKLLVILSFQCCSVSS